MSGVICGDALSELQKMPPSSVDFVVTDPPYANTGTGSSRVSKSGGVPDERQFYDLWMRELCSQISRVLRPTGAVWMSLDWRGSQSFEAACVGLDLKFGGVGVWDRGGLGMGYMLRHVYECFAVARMPKWSRVITDEPDLWSIKWTPGNRKHGHEAEKPVELMLRAMRLLGVGPGHVVLDPFAGSGTTGVAASMVGASPLLIEREQSFVEVADRRLRSNE